MTIAEAELEIPVPTKRRFISTANWLVCLIVPMLPIIWDLDGYIYALSTGWHGGYWRLLVAWLLYADILTMLAAPLLVAEGISHLGFPKTGRVAFIAGTTLVLSWCIIDLCTFQTGGHHASAYLPMIVNPAAAEGVGGYRLIVPQLLALVGTVTVCVSLCSVVCTWAVAPSKRGDSKYRRPAQILIVCLYAGSIFAPLLVGRLAGVPGNVDQLEAEDGGDWKTRANSPIDAQPFSAQLRTQLAPFLQSHGDALFRPKPLDLSTRIVGADRPNILLVVIESFRADAMNTELMPRLTKWSEQGLRLLKHRSGGNASQYGMFSLLYARSPAFYDATLDMHLMPQMCVTLRNSGYHCSYVGSVNSDGIAGMREFLNARCFDDYSTCDGLSGTQAGHGEDSWPGSDMMALDRAKKLLAQKGSPQFVVTFVVSTHYPYACPPEEKRGDQPVFKAGLFSHPGFARLASMRKDYNDSITFIDRIVAQSVQTLDMSHTIVVVTGDHGESLGQDGTLTHGFRVSDVETLVPCIIRGPGFAASQMSHGTRHEDILPTLLHAVAGRHVSISGCQGDDLLLPDFVGDRGLMSACIPEANHTLVVVEPDARLAIRLLRDPPLLQVLGPVDEFGNINHSKFLPLQQVDRWATAIQGELGRWLN